MLEVQNLVKDYRAAKQWHRAVNDVSFTINPNEIVGILGPNGAGKTTALRCIAGILKPTSGSIKINGYDIDTDQARAKAGLAYVPEVPSLYELLTVDEHLRFVAMAFNTVDVYEKYGTSLLERYHLIEKKNELVATLSKGMRQKLSVACALVHRANVLLFDEPLIGIDPAGVVEIKNELHLAKASGASVLISTHLLDTAEKLCDRILIFSRGKMKYQGTLDELRQLYNVGSEISLEELFLRVTGETIIESPLVSNDTSVH